MVITYYGFEFFKVQFGDIVIAFNPVSKESGEKTPRFGADIALISLEHPLMNGTENLSLGEREPFIIRGPGEYEIKGVFIKGFSSESSFGGKKRINTVYTVILEDITLCFLGALENAKIGSEARSELGNADIVFVPIGGNGVFTPDDANDFAASLEPKIIIPMHWEEKGGKEGKSLDIFLKEAGVEKAEKFEKLTVKKRDLENKEGEIVILSSVL
ncbi:MBL fold metallo-hydrolase [bacterium]|nr:MBL fold metallo-hydrolase [bacterium]MCI0680358.1 MBL fold metallo-hydrolase [bacterium]